MMRASLAAAAALAAGCGTSPTPGPDSTEGDRMPDPSTSPTPSRGTAGTRPAVLLAYFSRPGENYYYGDHVDLEVGNTEVLATMVAERIDCDVHRIEAAEPYSEDYDATVARNVREQDADARPAITNPLQSLEGYDVVLLASPIWNVRPPMLMKTFTEALDVTGITVHPLTTHAMSGLGTAVRDYTESCAGAFIAEGLAVQGETVKEAGDEVERWLRRAGLASS